MVGCDTIAWDFSALSFQALWFWELTAAQDSLLAVLAAVKVGPLWAEKGLKSQIPLGF